MSARLSWLTLLTLSLGSIGGSSHVSGQSAVQTKPELVLQTGHTGPVNAIALSPDGRFMVSAGDDTTLKVWDVSTANVLRTLFGHQKRVLGVAVSPDSKLIASGGEDGEVRVWSVDTGEARAFGSHTGIVKDLAFSADGRQLTSLGDTELKLWDVASGRPGRSTTLSEDKDKQRGQTSVGGVRFDQTATALTADGRFGAIGAGMTASSGVLGFGGGVRAAPIRIFETATGREIESFKLKGDLPAPKDLSFSPNGRLLVAKFTESGGKAKDLGSMVTVYDVATGRELKTFAVGDLGGSGGVAFSPDGKLLASRVAMTSAEPTSASALADFGGGSIKLIDVATWGEVRELKKTGVAMNFSLRAGASPLSFSGDGKLLAASLFDGVALIDTGSGSRVRMFQTTGRDVAAEPAAASSGEAKGASSFAADMLKQLQSLTGDMTALTGAGSPMAMGGGGALVSSGSLINFTPDGKLLLAANSSAVWDTAAGTPRKVPQEQARSFTFLLPAAAPSEGVFSQDGKMTASVAGTAIVVKEVGNPEASRTIQVGKPSGSKQTALPASTISGLAFGPGGVVVHYCDFKGSNPSAMMFGGSQECHVKIFDPKTGKELHDTKLDADKAAFPGMGTRSSLTPDGRFLAALALETGGRFKPSLPGIQGLGGGEPARQPYKLRFTDVSSGRKTWELSVESASMMAPPTFRVSPTGSVLAITTYEKKQPVITLHDTASGRKVATLDSGDRIIGTINFSADGRYLATTYTSSASVATGKPVTAAADAVVTVWDSTNGRQLHTLTHTTPVNGVAFNPSGTLIATVGRDRNEYLWDVQTGDKLLTLVNLDVLNQSGSANEWLAVTPDGLFDGSPAAWQQIMWRFSGNTFDVGPVEIFFNELYYPGLATEIFGGRRPKATRDLQLLDRRQPTVKVALKAPAAGEVKTRTVAIRIDVAQAPSDATHPKGSGARDVRLFRNGTLVKLWRGDVLKGQAQATLEVTIPIVAAENRITAYAFNDDNVKSIDAFLPLTGSQSLDRKGTAYVLAFGVNQYANAQYNLKYAGADASAFADEVRSQQGKLVKFDHVEVITLLDKDVTKGNIIAALKRLANDAPLPAGAPEALTKLHQAQPEDAVMIYFAGHGTASGPRFYLVPHDLGYTGSRSAVDGPAIETILAHSVSDLELEAAVEGLDAGELLMVIDACNSGQALEADEKRRGPMNSKGLAQLAYEKGMYILTAAQSYQAALETVQLGHGFLTYTLVEEGLKQGLADREKKDGDVTVREWFDYATERVPQMQEQNSGTRLLLDADDKTGDKGGVRNLQRPRAFYRRELEALPVVIGRP